MLTALSDSGTVNLDRLATFTAELVQRGLNVTVVSGDDESLRLEIAAPGRNARRGRSVADTLKKTSANAFGALLDALIRDSGRDAQDIAREVPCNPGHMSRLRQGQKHPSLVLAERLDEIFGVRGKLLAAAIADCLPAGQPAVLAAIAAAAGIAVPGQEGGRNADVLGPSRQAAI
jgi:hypothetical protein